MTLSPPAVPAGPTGTGRASGRRGARFLLVAGALGALSLSFVGFAPNRILSAAPVYLWQIRPDWVAWAILVGAVAIAGGLALSGVARPLAVLIGATLALLAAMIGAGASATAIIATATSPAARVSLGGGFWILLIASALIISDSLARLRLPLFVRALFAAAVVAVIAAFAATGWFRDLSLVHEWANRSDEYAEAFGEHLTLVGTSLVLGLLIGVPLGIIASARARASGRIFAILNLVQTIPSIALFGLLIGPLTGLSSALPFLRAIGVNGIGFAPAIVALVLYALLPVARNTEAGVRSVPADLLEAARGMGMTAGQSLIHVTLPLALPILLAGLRIVVVQLIGLAVVAALIGAGGFGSFVFLGLGQTATDLVLLGALSAIAIAVVADLALRLLTAAALARVAP